jgi:hypothetical protein
MTKAVNNFAGLNGFVWWVGVIINRADELGLGRCQVRIFGWTDSLSDEDLQWAHPMVPVNNSKTYQSPEIGDWVVGFFMDSEGGQFPVMMGVLPGFINSPYFQEQAST